MRCVGSSPAAASALRNRLAADPERLAEQVFDEDDEEGDGVDLEPTSDLEQDGPLAALVAQAESLAKVPDLKLDTLVKLLDPLIAEGANPVVFCRFIATAVLALAFGLGLTAGTGRRRFGVGDRNPRGVHADVRERFSPRRLRLSSRARCEFASHREGRWCVIPGASALQARERPPCEPGAPPA